MNIIFFAHFAGSPRHGMVYGHYYLAREWVNMGHSVYIIAAAYAHTRFNQPVQTGKVTAEDIDGIHYIWLPVPAYRPDSVAGRAKNILSFTLRSRFMKMPVSNAELVICSSHHPFPIYSARHYARKLDARLIFEVRDLWPLTLIELGGISRRNPFIACMQRAEDFAYRHADKVVSTLPGAKVYMASRGMNPGKFVYIPNGADLRDQTERHPLPAEHVKKMEEFRTKWEFIVGYAGKIGLSNALHTLIESLTICPVPIAVALLGYGAFAEDLKVRASKLGVSERVLFLDPVGKDQVSDFLKRVDATYVGALRSPLYRFGMSLTKLNDFMLAGKPVIYAVDAPDNVIAESGAGISCPPENPEALSQAMMEMKGIGETKRKEMGDIGHNWVLDNRDYSLLAKRLLREVTHEI